MWHSHNALGQSTDSAGVVGRPSVPVIADPASKNRTVFRPPDRRQSDDLRALGPAACAPWLGPAVAAVAMREDQAKPRAAMHAGSADKTFIQAYLILRSNQSVAVLTEEAGWRGETSST